MGLFSNLFGRKKEAEGPSTPATPPASSGEETVSLSLQILLESWDIADEAALREALASYDPSLRPVEITRFVRADGEATLADLTWQKQSFRLAAFNSPMPKIPVETCIAPSHYDSQIKNRAREHRAHALLFCESPRSQILRNYARLAMLCGGILRESGGLAVLNERAQTSLPAALWTEDDAQTKPAVLWTKAPLLYLYAGFVKFNLPDSPQVWMTTRGLDVFGLPNLTHLAPDHSHGSATMEIFENVAAYMVSNGPVLGAGHTMQIGTDTFMRLRAPATEQELAVADGKELLIADFIGADQTLKNVFPSKGVSN